jgi:peptidoglycan hydrolase-like protein with peptidoglycan-binding domain
MSARLRRIAITACLLVVTLLSIPAHARGTAAVTLSASAPSVTFGETVTLTVAISPPAAGEPVSILDAAGEALASGTTGADGTFTATVKPDANLVAHASWGGVDSSSVSVGLRPAMKLGRGPIRLFDTLTVRGAFKPVRAGAPVTVELQHRGSVVATTHPKLTGKGRFSTTFRIVEAGSYRLRAVLDAVDLLPGRASTAPSLAPFPSDLAIGSRGPSVSALERRLVELHYHLTGVDDVFDYRTADAVMAFRKVQRLPRTQDVNIAVWHALGTPRLFAPSNRAAGFHIEVDQTRQVLATVENGKVVAMIHVSTGKPSTPTRDGSFHIYSKLAGFSEKQLYYPSFFDGERAIHGWTDVPTYAASHGCVRIPYWVTKWMFALDPIGTPVLIYH